MKKAILQDAIKEKSLINNNYETNSALTNNGINNRSLRSVNNCPSGLPSGISLATEGSVSRNRQSMVVELMV
jgi:hypothetical protein